MTNELEKLKKENQELKQELERLKARGETQKQGMVKKAIKGRVMSRAPFGYRIENKQLIPVESYQEVEEIFEEFLKDKISLRKLAEKHNLSVNGL
ncbi:MAG: hypothetical protein IH964_06920, partial [Candidatus Dadabacteria bacterium]|nr:hypothetical protein [Candidatus Dadabacteria bacterium]